MSSQSSWCGTTCNSIYDQEGFNMVVTIVLYSTLKGVCAIFLEKDVPELTMNTSLALLSWQWCPPESCQNWILVYDWQAYVHGGWSAETQNCLLFMYIPCYFSTITIIQWTIGFVDFSETDTPTISLWVTLSKTSTILSLHSCALRCCPYVLHSPWLSPVRSIRHSVPPFPFKK